MLITQIFPSFGYKEEYGEVLEKRKQLNKRGLRAKAHTVDDAPLEDFSLIFEKACDEVKRGGYVYDQNAD